MARGRAAGRDHFGVTEPTTPTARDVYRWGNPSLGALAEALEYDLILRLAQADRGQHWLDVGCGDGALVEKLARTGADVTGVDADPAAIARAKRRNVGKFLAASGTSLPFPDGSFDGVCAVTVLCLVPSPDRVIAEMARVLKPGGVCILGELGRWSTWALSRRLRGFAGNRFWRAARFFDRAMLTDLVQGAGLTPTAFRGAVYFPPIPVVASIMAPADRFLPRHMGQWGAAFLALRVVKSGLAHPDAP